MEIPLDISKINLHYMLSHYNSLLIKNVIVLNITEMSRRIMLFVCARAENAFVSPALCGQVPFSSLGTIGKQECALWCYGYGNNRALFLSIISIVTQLCPCYVKCFPLGGTPALSHILEHYTQVINYNHQLKLLFQEFHN